MREPANPAPDSEQVRTGRDIFDTLSASALRRMLPEGVVRVLRPPYRLLRRVKHHRDLAAYRSEGLTVVHFLHIGKTGGTAIKDALKPVLTTDAYRIELHGHDVTLRDVPVGDKVFFFLRDPISRFVSGFYSRKRRGQPRHFSPWTRAEETAFQSFQTPNQLALGLSSQERQERLSALKAMRSIYHVKSHYRDWFQSEKYLLSRLPDILLIGFQESLEEDFELLKQLLGLPGWVSLPKDPIRSHRNPVSLKTDLDPEARGNLRRWYARDYDFLRLCKSLRAEIDAQHPPVNHLVSHDKQEWRAGPRIRSARAGS